MLTSIPLFKLVKQEYIPSDVDESEFEVNVRAPEGTSLAGIDEAMRAIEAELRQVHGVRDVLATAGGGFLGGVNQGNVFVRIAPHEERKFSISRFLNGLRPPRSRAPPSAATTASGGDAGGPQAALQKFKDLRIARCATSRRSTSAAAASTSTSPCAARTSRRSPATPSSSREKSKELGGIVDADTTLKLDKPELRVEVDRERAAALGVDMSDVGSALQLMVGGDAAGLPLPRPGRSTTTTTSSSGSPRGPATIRRRSSGLFVPRPGRQARTSSATSSPSRRRPRPPASTAWTASGRSACAPASLPATRWRTGWRRCSRRSTR